MAYWVWAVFRSMRASGHLAVFVSLVVLLVGSGIVIGYLEAIYGFYEVVLGVPSDKKVIVVSGFSVSPFTSLISKEEVERLVARFENKIDRIVYEQLSLIMTRDRVVVLRGIRKSDLRYLAPSYSVLVGQDFNDECSYCVWVGERLATRMELKPGDKLIVSSVWSGAPLVLIVKGILSVPEPFSYELIGSPIVGMALRGTSSKHASIALIFPKPGTSLGKIIGEKKGLRVLLEKLFVALRHGGKKIRVLFSSSFSEAYWARIGLQREFFVSLSISFSILFVLGAYIVGLAVFSLSYRNLEILYTLGVSIYRLKLGIVLLVCGYSVVAGFIAYSLLASSSNIFALWLAEHPLRPMVSFEDVLAPLLALCLFSSIGVIRSRVEES